jgi:hypothetical protein
VDSVADNAGAYLSRSKRGAGGGGVSEGDAAVVQITQQYMVDLHEEVVTTDDEDEEAEPLPHYHYGVRLPP